MSALDKVWASADEAVAGIPSGASLAVGGSGLSGVPIVLNRTEVSDLEVASDNCGPTTPPGQLGGTAPGVRSSPRSAAEPTPHGDVGLWGGRWRSPNDTTGPVNPLPDTSAHHRSRLHNRD